MAKKKRFHGSATFNTFSYLLNGAQSFHKTAQEHSPGSGYCRIGAVVFSAFAVEAYLNHLGEAELSLWAKEERMSWSEKIDCIAKHLGIKVKRGSRPYQTVKNVFAFRNDLAHGRTETVAYRDSGRSEPDDHPEWLEKFTKTAAVLRALEDARGLMELLHQAAGLGFPLDMISTGAYFES